MFQCEDFEAMFFSRPFLSKTGAGHLYRWPGGHVDASRQPDWETIVRDLLFNLSSTRWQIKQELFLNPGIIHSFLKHKQWNTVSNNKTTLTWLAKRVRVSDNDFFYLQLLEVASCNMLGPMTNTNIQILSNLSECPCDCVCVRCTPPSEQQQGGKGICPGSTTLEWLRADDTDSLTRPRDVSGAIWSVKGQLLALLGELQVSQHKCQAFRTLTRQTCQANNFSQVGIKYSFVLDIYVVSTCPLFTQQSR